MTSGSSMKSWIHAPVSEPPLFAWIKCNNLGRVTHSSCQREWCSHQAFLEGGSCYICSAAVNCGFGVMHRFGSSGCFGNVLIKASLRLRSRRLIFKGKHFHSTQIPHHCVLCDFCAARNILSPLCEGSEGVVLLVWSAVWVRPQQNLCHLRKFWIILKPLQPPHSRLIQPWN